MIRIAIAFILLLPIYGLAATTAPTTYTSFEPGAVWLDTDGNSINCHGGGFLFQKGTYYWFGEHKVSRQRPGHIGVACYSSTDLFNWKNEGLALSAGADTGDLVDGCVIERPKVIYNSKTTKYVMWFHLELKGHRYDAARAAVAISDTPTGPFKYLESFRPDAGQWPMNFSEDQKQPATAPAGSKLDGYVRRDFANGQMSRDMTLFQDDDGTAYQITASEENQTLHISKLTDDYLKTSGQYVRILVGKANEAPTIFKRNGKYYLISSGTTGWKPNAARLATADAIMGPWKYVGNPCVGPKEQTDLTFESQAACVLPVAGKPDAFIYVGDRWNARNLPDSRYIFLPIIFTDDHVSIAWKDRWDLSEFK